MGRTIGDPHAQGGEGGRQPTFGSFAPADASPLRGEHGDGWEHTIKVERMTTPEPGIVYPRLIEASGRCPPEDVGGPWGYGEMLEALEDPGHERHAETLEWLGEDFDPNALNAEPLKADVAALAKRWTKRPSAKKTRST